MNRILNLNNYSNTIMVVVGVLALLIPGLLKLVEQMLGKAGVSLPVLGFVIRLSIGGGLLLLAAFALLILLEQLQDWYLYRRYPQDREKLASAHECLYCGNRQVHSFDYNCLVCGKELRRGKEFRRSREKR